MLLTLDTEILDAAIKSVTNIAGADAEGVVFFRVVGPHILRVSSVNKGKGVAIYIPCEVKDKSENKSFAIEPKSFQSAIAGRKDLNLTIGETTVTVSSKKYKAELVTTAAEAERVLPEEIKEGKDGIKLSQDLLEFIRTNLDAVELKPTLETYSFIPISVKATSKGSIIVCYDNWHMAFATGKVTGDLQFTLPAQSLSLLVKEFQGKSYKVHLTDTALYAYNDSFELSLPLPQVDAQNNSIGADEAFELAKKIRSEEEGTKVFLAAEDIKTLSANIEAVYKKGEHIFFSVEKDECKIMLKSTHGKIVSSARCKSDKKIEFKTGFGFLRDILSKVTGKKLEVQVIPERMLFFNSDNRTFMIALLGKETE